MLQHFYGNLSGPTNKTQPVFASFFFKNLQTLISWNSFWNSLKVIIRQVRLIQQLLVWRQLDMFMFLQVAKKENVKQKYILSPRMFFFFKKSYSDLVCKLHIAFHGCLMGPDSIQDTFAQNSGLNQWAESNNVRKANWFFLIFFFGYQIIVVYPQVIKTNLPYNPEGW